MCYTYTIHVLYISLILPDYGFYEFCGYNMCSFLNYFFSIRSLVRIIKSMKGHVPGLNHLNIWYIELIVSLIKIQ